MKKTLKIALTATLSCVLIVAIAGIIKFNFFDASYDGEPITYVSSNGESITVHFKTDNSVEISGQDFETTHLDPSSSASGARYSNEDGSFVFWNKGNQAMLLRNDIITFRGQQEKDQQNALSGSVWIYTGSQINDELQNVANGTQIILNFDNNRFFGEAGCNSYFGSYHYNPEKVDQIIFSNLGTSMALCEDNVMNQEDLFLNALASTTSITINENTMSLHYATGKSLQFKLFGSRQ